MDSGDLDERLDGELRRLPRPRAPRSLLPRVLAATVDHGLAASATGWFTWPLRWRITSLTVMLAVAAVAWMFLTAPPQGVANAVQNAGEIATVVRAFWEVMLQPVVTYLFVLGISLTLACALAWAALDVALGGASQQ
ncbi:MAG: hypothetical protein H0U19_14230 [Acidobacteria bacterium]|nr:hypothetical protein [Acidobacteriota bacterium]